MSSVEGLLFPFLLGGTLIAGVKYLAMHLNNPALAAIFAAAPTGLISIYFISSAKSISYSRNYFYVTLALLTSIVVFYLLHVHTNMSKDLVLALAILAWASLVGLHYFLSDKNNTSGK